MPTLNLEHKSTLFCEAKALAANYFCPLQFSYHFTLTILNCFNTIVSQPPHHYNQLLAPHKTYPHLMAILSVKLMCHSQPLSNCVFITSWHSEDNLAYMSVTIILMTMISINGKVTHFLLNTTRWENLILLRILTKIMDSKWFKVSNIISYSWFVYQLWNQPLFDKQKIKKNWKWVKWWCLLSFC